MEINSDFKELLRSLNEFGVRYLVIGGYAVMKYTEPRYTKDLDIWIDPSQDNAERAFNALASFGAPLANLSIRDFTDTSTVYQLGVPPVRIDILKEVRGLSFSEAWPRRIEGKLGDQMAAIISRDDLITIKEASGRRQDRLDLRMLRKAAARDRPPHDL